MFRENPKLLLGYRAFRENPTPLLGYKVLEGKANTTAFWPLEKTQYCCWLWVGK
jgi:hypothetical protein